MKKLIFCITLFLCLFVSNSYSLVCTLPPTQTITYQVQLPNFGSFDTTNSPDIPVIIPGFPLDPTRLVSVTLNRTVVDHGLNWDIENTQSQPWTQFIYSQEKLMWWSARPLNGQNPQNPPLSAYVFCSDSFQSSWYYTQMYPFDGNLDYQGQSAVHGNYPLDQVDQVNSTQIYMGTNIWKRRFFCQSNVTLYASPRLLHGWYFWDNNPSHWGSDPGQGWELRVNDPNIRELDLIVTYTYN